MRTTLVLAAVALGLLGYILLVEKDTLSSRELEQREHSVLPEMVRAKVSRIEVQRKGVSVVLERTLDVDDERGLWHVVEPYQARADEDAVDTLLGELEWMDSRRRLTDVSEADGRRFGFDAPRYRVRFRVGSLDVTARVGSESPRGEGVYVQGHDRTQAFVVGKDLLEALDQEPEHYHTKELHEGVLVATTTDVELRDASGQRRVTRRPDRLFEITEGGRGLASGPAVRAVIDAVDALRASRFVATGVNELASYGLDAPTLDLTLHRRELASDDDDEKRDAKGDADRDAKSGSKGSDEKPDSKPRDGKGGDEHEPRRVAKQLRLRLGGPCGEHTDERYLRVDDDSDVFCALEADLVPLHQDLDALRERRALPLEDDEVASVRIEQGGRVLTLTRGDDGWTRSLEGSGHKKREDRARQGSVEEWLAALRSAQAEQLDAGALGSPRVKLVFERRKTLPAFELEASPSVSAVIAQRAHEPFTIALPPAALELLSPPAARFRPLRLSEREEPALSVLELERDGLRERATRGEAGAWSLEAPVRADGDRTRLGELARLLAKLEAVHMVADAREPEHGLAPPAATLRARFGEDAGLALHIGAETEGGRFAELEGDPTVFVIASRLWDQVATPWLSRTALAVPIEQIRAIVIERAGRSVRIEGDGTAFTGDGLSPERARAVAEAVATLRATAITGYGPVDASEGLATAHARVTIELDDGGDRAERELLVGGVVEQGRRHVRRADLDAGFVLPDSQVQALLSALP